MRKSITGDSPAQTFSCGAEPALPCLRGALHCVPLCVRAENAPSRLIVYQRTTSQRFCQSFSAASCRSRFAAQSLRSRFAGCAALRSALCTSRKCTLAADNCFPKTTTQKLAGCRACVPAQTILLTKGSKEHPNGTCFNMRTQKKPLI